jgi:hypothetical protein
MTYESAPLVLTSKFAEIPIIQNTSANKPKKPMIIIVSSKSLSSLDIFLKFYFFQFSSPSINNMKIICEGIYHLQMFQIVIVFCTVCCFFGFYQIANINHSYINIIKSCKCRISIGFDKFQSFYFG